MSDEHRHSVRREVLLVGELSDAELEAIANAEVPQEFAHLDAELEPE